VWNTPASPPFIGWNAARGGPGLADTPVTRRRTPAGCRAATRRLPARADSRAIGLWFRGVEPGLTPLAARACVSGLSRAVSRPLPQACLLLLSSPGCLRDATAPAALASRQRCEATRDALQQLVGTRCVSAAPSPLCVAHQQARARGPGSTPRLSEQRQPVPAAADRAVIGGVESQPGLGRRNFVGRHR